jgi:hypothetical protein
MLVMLSDLTGVLGLTMRTKEVDLTNWAHRHASKSPPDFPNASGCGVFANLDGTPDKDQCPKAADRPLGTWLHFRTKPQTTAAWGLKAFSLDISRVLQPQVFH